MPGSKERSDDSLLDRARQGSKSAMNRLLSLYRSWLVRRAKAKLPKALNAKQDASDAVQVCQMTVVDHLGEFDGSNLSEFRRWMAKILDHVIQHDHRFWRQKKRDHKREQPLAPECGRPIRRPGSHRSSVSSSGKRRWSD